MTNGAKIKCRDLMIGDWIQDEHGFRFYIVGLGEDYAYATFEGNEGDPCKIDPCYGIPLDEVREQVEAVTEITMDFDSVFASYRNEGRSKQNQVINKWHCVV